MQDEGVSLDKVTFICVLGVCATLGALDQGRLVHAHIIKSGLLSGVFIENTLISMYTRCASIEEAEQVFCHMSLQDNVSWNALILGYVHHGNDRQVLSIFQQIEQKGMIPNKVAFIGILNACVNLSSLYQGEHVHVQIKEAGYGSDLFVCNKLIDMYSKCGNIENARGVFNNMSIRNIVSWTSIITGYAQLSMGEEALNLFCAMQDEDIDPNEITFVSVLSACGTLGVLEQAKWVHSHVIESGCMSNQFVGNTLIDMYAKCGSLEDAEYSFDRLPLRNIVSWNALITGYAIHQNGVEVVKIFQQMQQERMSPNLVTFSNIINACAASGNLGQGKYVHSLIEWTQIETNVYVGTALVDMYAKCGRVQDAKQVFQSMPARNIISWTTMVACLCEKNAKEAIILFKQMEKEGLEPDTVTFVYVLNACASLAAIGKGKWLHAQNINTRCVFVGNALIDMHAKCGKIQHACQVFDRMHIHDSVSWNAIIAGYAAQGYGRKAVHLFRSMQLASIKPDLLTFISLLSACSHSGLMSEGHHYYVSMTMEHVVSPTGDHFASVVALLGRNGSLDEAEDFVTSMPLEPCVVVLTAFLSVCKIHMELDMAKNALERVLRLEDQNSSAYVLLSNIYGAAGWEDDNLVTKI